MTQISNMVHHLGAEKTTMFLTLRGMWKEEKLLWLTYQKVQASISGHQSKPRLSIHTCTVITQLQKTDKLSKIQSKFQNS
jgi:hypothetical protein